MRVPWQTSLERAFAHRLAFLNEARIEGTNTFRIFGGAAEGIPGLTIDVYGPVGFLQVFEGQCALSFDELRSIGKWLKERLDLQAFYLKSMHQKRFEKGTPQDLTSPEPLVGVAMPKNVEAFEKGLRFNIFPYDGYSVGLFLDQRENRVFLANRYSESVSTALNLFSYTCGFSVHLAKQGVGTASVDLSKRSLERGRENLRLNGLPVEGHEFYASDAFSVLDRWKRKGRRATLVIADPPSFSRTKEGVPFSIKADWKKLLEAMEGVADRAIFFSCNYAEWEPNAFREAVMNFMGKSWAEVELPPAPFDFSFAGSPLKQILIERT